jgi:hypothetical protein
MNDVSPFDFLKPSTEFSDREKSLNRLRICGSCPELSFKVCGICHCFMPMKTKLEAATCPIGKW